MSQPGHILNERFNDDNAKKVCPKCGLDYRHWHVINYDPVWRDGDVVCECGERIRGYDAG